MDQEASDLLTADMLAQYSASISESMVEDSHLFASDTQGSAVTADDDEADEEHEADDEDHEQEDGGDDDEGPAEAEAEEEEEEAPVEPEPVVLAVQAPPPKEEEVMELSEEELAAEEARISAEEEAELMRQQSAGQRRMSDFLSKIRMSVDRHRTHPRRRSKKFSIPLMFSEDIYFDPFEVGEPEEIEEDDAESAKVSLAGGTVSTADQLDPDDYYDPYTDIGPPKDPFHDVNSKLVLFRKEEERKRKQLFSTTLQEVPLKDWIRVFRTYVVDWDGFFARQPAMVELQQAVKESEEEIERHFRYNDPLKKITDTLSVSSPARSPNMSPTMSMASMSGRFSEANSEEPTTVTVTLLPYGTILEHQRVKQGAYKYYKIEQEKQSMLLTVEIQCLSGLVDLYIAYQKLPSAAMHDRHIACTKDNKTARLAFRPHKSGTFFIAVRSHETAAKFNIWTYKASGIGEQSPIIGRVNNILRKFEILASVNEDELQEFFPKFEKEANKTVAEEIAERKLRDAEEASLQESSKHEQRQLGDDDSLDELYDIESVGRFIAKVSKYTLQGDQIEHDDRDDYQMGLDDDEEELLEQEYGQEIDDMLMPMHSSKSIADLMLDEFQANDTTTSPRAQNEEGGLTLPPIGRATSTPSLNFTRSSVTMESYLTDESDNKLPGIKGASVLSATGHSHSHSQLQSQQSLSQSQSRSSNVKRMVSKSRSSISLAREYAALDRALTEALGPKRILERKERVENPYLHQVPKPVKYQLTGNKT